MPKTFKSILTALFLCVLVPLFPVKAQTPLPACSKSLVTTLPAPGDYGGAGQFIVTRQTIQHPNPNVPDVVSVFLPSNATPINKVPVIFFAHGFGATNYQFYESLMQQAASNGYAVVFAPYAFFADSNAARYDQMWTGFQLAVQQYGNVMDTTKVGFAGHSYGGGAVPEMARRAVAQGWGANGLFLFPMAAAFAWGTDYSAIPANAKLVVQVYWDDNIVDHLISENDIWNKLPQITERRWQVVRTSNNCYCSLNADHNVPIADNIDQVSTNALDFWGVRRRMHALADYTFNSNMAAKAVAFGDDTQMGRWRRCPRSVTPLQAANTPILNAQQNALLRWEYRCFFADLGFPCP